MRVTPTPVQGVLLLTPQVFTDARGSFQETYNRRAFAEATGVDPAFVQDNHSHSVLSAQADVLYKATDYYAPEHERCIAWDDPDLAVDWPLREAGVTAPLLSTRDAAGARFAAAGLPEATAGRDPRSV